MLLRIENHLDSHEAHVPRLYPATTDSFGNGSCTRKEFSSEIEALGVARSARRGDAVERRFFLSPLGDKGNPYIGFPVPGQAEEMCEKESWSEKKTMDEIEGGRSERERER